MNENDIQLKMLRLRHELNQIRTNLQTVNQARLDEKQRKHTKRALASIDTTMQELAAAVWYDHSEN